MAELDSKLALERGRGLDEVEGARLAALMPELKKRPKTLLELYDNMLFILDGEPRSFEAKAAKLLDDSDQSMLDRLGAQLSVLEPWTESRLEHSIRDFAGTEGMKLGAVAQPLRAALTGRTASPGIFEVLAVLGREESLARMTRTAAAT